MYKIQHVCCKFHHLCKSFFFVQIVTKGIYFISQISKVGGAIMFGLGIWTVVDKNFMNELLGTNLFAGATYVLIITSALVCMVSFFGCIGAAKEVKCMLLTVRILSR